MDAASVGAQHAAPLPADRASPAPPAIADFACQISLAAGGRTVAENLALACVSCSLRKAARQTALDPQTGQGAALFNPRRDIWYEHFRWEGVYLVGLTATGRATITALDINRTLILAIRQEEAALGRHPSS